MHEKRRQPLTLGGETRDGTRKETVITLGSVAAIMSLVTTLMANGTQTVFQLWGGGVEEVGAHRHQPALTPKTGGL